MNNSLDLDAIKARADAATVGPWTFEHRDGYHAYESQVIAASLIPLDLAPEVAEVLDGGDAEFIAHARTDVPALVAEVGRLRAVILSAWQDVDHNCASYKTLSAEVRGGSQTEGADQ